MYRKRAEQKVHQTQKIQKNQPTKQGSQNPEMHKCNVSNISMLRHNREVIPISLHKRNKHTSIENEGYEADKGESDIEFDGDDTERESPPPAT